MAHFGRAKSDERKVSDDYWRSGGISLRVPISGAGRFKSDVFAITNGEIHFCLVRRTESDNVEIKFNSREIRETIEQAKKVEELLSIPVVVKLVAHFPKKRKWKERIIYRTDYT